MFQEHCVVFFYFLKYFEIVDTIVLAPSPREYVNN